MSIKAIENIKIIAECITAISAAIIVVSTAIKTVNNVFNKFKNNFFNPFFIGTFSENGTKARFFKGLKAHKEYQRREKNILNTFLQDYKMEDVYIVNLKELQKIVLDSKILIKYTKRK